MRSCGDSTARSPTYCTLAGHQWVHGLYWAYLDVGYGSKSWRRFQSTFHCFDSCSCGGATAKTCAANRPRRNLALIVERPLLGGWINQEVPLCPVDVGQRREGGTVIGDGQDEVATGCLNQWQLFTAFWGLDLDLARCAQVEHLIEAVEDGPVPLQRLLAEQCWARRTFNYRRRESTHAVGAIRAPESCVDLAIPQALLSASTNSSDNHWSVALLLSDRLAFIHSMSCSLSDELSTDQIAP